VFAVINSAAAAIELAAEIPARPGSAASRRARASGASPGSALPLQDVQEERSAPAGDALGRPDETGLVQAVPTGMALASAPGEPRDVALVAEAVRLLDEARNLPEVKQAMDYAWLVRQCVRKARLGLKAQNAAAAIHIEAQAKAGNLLREMAEKGARHPQGRTSEVAAGDFTAPTLADLGIKRIDAYRWEQVAAVPAKIRADYVTKAGDRNAEVSRAGLLNSAGAQRTPDQTADETADVTAAVNAEPWVKLGGLYLLGDHRLLVGDATDPAKLDRLMAGKKAALLATDPPYLVNYRADNHPESWLGSPTSKDKSWDDYHDPAAGAEFYRAFLAAALPHLEPDAPVYQWHAEQRRSLVEAAWEACGLHIYQIIIWVKSRPVLTHSHYMWGHEPCAYGWRAGHEPALRPPASATTVWQVGGAGEPRGLHPTQKPVELFRRPIEHHTIPGDIVLDPFAGSGPAIIAAEQTGRRAFCIEISPAFAQAAIERWQDLTGRKAVAA
jgi:DNA modification methylase